MSFPPSFHSYFGGKKVLVTGGSSGIGKALAQALLRLGAEVAIVGHQAELLQRATAELAGDHSARVPPRAYSCDLSKPEETAQLAARVREEFGTPDILINNAGFAVYRTFEQFSPQEVGDLLEVNLGACLRLTHALLPGFIARRSGAVVNVASVAGKLPITPNSVYSAAKHGLVAWSQCLSCEVSRFGVQVNIICPGRVLTPFFDHETFRRRTHRPETEYTVPMATVVNKTLEAIVRDRLITYVPWTFAVAAWALNTFPLILGPLFRHLSRQRIETIYQSEAVEAPRSTA